MSGNQPEKGVRNKCNCGAGTDPLYKHEWDCAMFSATRATPEVVTGVAPQTIASGWHLSKEAYEAAPAPQEQELLKRKGIDPVEWAGRIVVEQGLTGTSEGDSRRRIEYLSGLPDAPAPQPMSAEVVEIHDCARQGFDQWRDTCKQCSGGEKQAAQFLDDNPKIWATTTKMAKFAANQHAALMQRNAELYRWLNDAATVLRSDLDSVGKAAAALIAEQDEANKAVEGWKEAAFTLGLRPDALNVWRNERAEAAEREISDAKTYMREAGDEHREWKDTDTLATWVHNFGKDIEAEAALRRLRGGEWVNVKERLPNEPNSRPREGFGEWSCRVLVLHTSDTGTYQSVDSYFHTHDKQRGFWSSLSENITHWRELPAPPTAEPLCADCGHARNDSRFHLDAPGENWGAALHAFKSAEPEKEGK